MFCQSQAFPTDKNRKFQICLFFYFEKKPKVFKKKHNFKIWIKKS